jgi:taurine dioxygenase
MEKASQLKFEPLSDHLGAEVNGCDLAAWAEDGDTAIQARLQDALDHHIVLLFKRQTLTPGLIEAIGRRFGPLMNLKRPTNMMGFKDPHHVPGIQNLKVLSNGVAEDGRPLGDGAAAAQDWHSDGAMQELPGSYTYFYARAVPPVPPRTYWMNAYKVYEALPAALKQRIANLRIIHHHYPAGNEFPLPPSLPLEERRKGPVHPIARIHPRTGKPFLYLPHRSDALVEGWSERDSAALVGELRTFAACMPFSFGTALNVDDFVIWDNRPSYHRRDSWNETETRVLWHLANIGEAPIAYAAPTALAS